MLAMTAVFAIYLAGPPLPREVMESPFGIVCPWMDVGKGGMGAVWCRCGGGATSLGDWPGMQPLADVFRWDDADSEMTRYDQQSLVPTPILSYTPEWASRAPGIADPRSRPPVDLWDYYRFCRAISARYAGRVWFWEIWNEPNIGFFEGTISDYADMVKAGACGVLAGSPTVYVIFGGMAGIDRPFLDRCYQHGVRDFFDVMACHPYQWGATFNDRWFFEKLKNCRAVIDAQRDPGKPIWLNELGWSTGDAAITEDIQARLLVQCYVSAMSRRDLGIQRIFWFAVKDWGGPGYGVYADDSRKKPAWYAYQTMATSLHGMKCLGPVTTGEGVRAYAFAPDEGDRAVVVLWSADAETHETSLSLRAKPTRAWDLLGKDLPLGEVVGGKLALRATPAPVYIETVRGDLAGLRPVTALAIPLPDPARRTPAWISVYPQGGCDLPWLWRGRNTVLGGRLFDATARPLRGTVMAQLVDDAGKVLCTARTPVAAETMTDARFSLDVPCPATAPAEAVLKVTADVAGAKLCGLALHVLVADGPTISFLANSHLERMMYVQPDAKGGCSESMRFGSEWVYKLPVPFEGQARVRMLVGANAAAQWGVTWSADGKSWHDLMAGASWPDWHEKTADGLKPGSLYLKCAGKDEQVGEVRVTFVPTAK